MKKILMTAVAAIGVGAKIANAAFVPGNLIILTDPNTTENAGSITLDEFTYNGNGTFNTTPTQHALSGITIEGIRGAGFDHDGLLQMSTNGQYLTFGGYLAPSGTTTPVASAVARGIGVVDSNWNTATVPVSNYTGGAIRSVASTDGKHFWTGGDQGTDGGQYYIDATGPTPTQTQIRSDDSRGNRIDGGQLYSVSSSVGGVSKIGTGLPMSSASSTLIMSGNYAKSDVIFLDLDGNGTSETAYTTDGKSAIGRWRLIGGTWTSTGTWDGTKTSINNIDALAAYPLGNSIEILADTSSGQLFQFTDSAPTTGTLVAGFLGSSTPSPFTTLAGNPVLRGMVLIPEPATAMLAMVLSVPMLASRRRKNGAR